MLQWAPLRANMNDYRVVPSMKQGSYSFAPSIKREKGALFRNSLVMYTIIKEVGPLKAVPHLKKQGAPCGNPPVINTI